MNGNNRPAHPYPLGEEEAAILAERLKALRELYRGSSLEREDLVYKHKRELE